MSDRGGIVTFFLFLFLSIIVLLQILSMVQLDRSYKRLNHLSDMQRSMERSRNIQNQ